jgi:hypothetical protein
MKRPWAFNPRGHEAKITKLTFGSTVASQLGTTEGTIKVHRGRVMEKMGATSVAELVILAQKAGIAPASADATKV